MGILEKIKTQGNEDYSSCKKVILAYSGGLDTSVILKLLLDLGLEVVTLTVDLGGNEYGFDGLLKAKQKAISLGASKAIVVEAKKEFVKDYVCKAVFANCLYQGAYPCSTALARPLISKYLAQVAKQEGADAVVHGSTGKGNDFLRFEVSITALSPSLKVLAPVRDWQLNRAEEIAYAESAGIPVPVDVSKPYSIDANLWGRSVSGGATEIEYKAVPEDALDWVASLEETPSQPASVKLFFSHGVPCQMKNGEAVTEGTLEVIEALNKLAGSHGVGTIDMIEDRVIGLKSREFYECPAALAILKAHAELERLCLPKEVNLFKPLLDHKFAEYCYGGFWHSKAMRAVSAYIESTQEDVNGWVEVKLFKGSCSVTARQSPNGLYSLKKATYGEGSSFNQDSSKGFGKIYALSTQTASAHAGGKND